MITETMTVHEALSSLKTLDARITKEVNRAGFTILHKACENKINGAPLADEMDKIKSRYNSIFSVKISVPLENTGVSSVFATSVWPFSLIFSLARRNEGNFFQAVPTTLSSSLAEVRLASLVAWA